jgi:glycerol kinase
MVCSKSHHICARVCGRAWDRMHLDVLNIPQEILPHVRAFSQVYGSTDPVAFCLCILAQQPLRLHEGYAQLIR